MNENFVPDEIAKDFEDYFGKTRGMTVAVFGLDVAANMETACKVAFFAGYGCGLAKAEQTILKK